MSGHMRGLIALLLLVTAPWAAALEQLEVEYVRPGVDFSQYTQVMIHPLNLERTKVIPPAWASDQSRKHWDLSADDRAFTQQLFLSTLTAEVEKDSRFHVVPFTGPGIMELEVKITSVTPFANRDEQVVTKGSGEISVRAEFIDGASGDLIAVLSGDQSVGDSYQLNSIDTNRANVERLVTAWGKRLLNHLRAAQR
ncbi:hypothetical protein M5M_06840 [Simiduia agarivorans SA1 = DSM 21679]|uniref:Lipoprotein n=2 Tax=Simiduia TaxID=447467 RepID=K4KKJ0_SIMAS|nr:hypothetical protein M5M_06840 [Simiduia agarivorans SA1 = DSM 21679]